MVYFILDRERQAVKIGVSDDPKKRLAGLQTSHVGELELLATTPGEFERERELHEQFAPLRIRGEWFRATESLMGFVAKLGGAVAARIKGAPKSDRELLMAGLCIMCTSSEVALSGDPDERQREILTIERKLHEAGITREKHSAVYGTWDRAKYRYPRTKIKGKRRKKPGGYAPFSRSRRRVSGDALFNQMLAHDCRNAGLPPFTLSDVRYTAAVNSRRAFGLDLDENDARIADGWIAGGWPEIAAARPKPVT